VIDGLVHHFFTTHPRDPNIVAAKDLILQIVNELDPIHAVIFGADMNAVPGEPVISELTRTLSDTPAALDPQRCTTLGEPLDYVMYRGPYRLASVEHRCPYGLDLTDHPWHVATLHEQTLRVRLGHYSCVPVGFPVQVTVHADDAHTHAPVSGSVPIAGQGVGKTNTLFTHTFTPTASPGIVSAPGYFDESFSIPLCTLEELKALVQGRAFGIWIGRVRGGGQYWGNDWSDWFRAKAELGIPPDVLV
jgi:hypothetical protein